MEVRPGVVLFGEVKIVGHDTPLASHVEGELTIVMVLGRQVVGATTWRTARGDHLIARSPTRAAVGFDPNNMLANGDTPLGFDPVTPINDRRAGDGAHSPLSGVKLNLTISDWLTIKGHGPLDRHFFQTAIIAATWQTKRGSGDQAKQHAMKVLHGTFAYFQRLEDLPNGGREGGRFDQPNRLVRTNRFTIGPG